MGEKVGFVGMGLMGKPMSLNLLKAGFDVTVYNRTREKTKDVVAQGGTAVDSPAAVARRCPVVITMVSDSPDVREVVLGKNGVLEGCSAGHIVIDMSSISPTVTKEIAAALQAQGVHMLDAPVSGGDVGAIQGTLSIMAGGEEAIFNRCMPLFQAMGKKIVHMGGTGAGQVTKLANQIVGALILGAIGEALVLGTKAGIEPARMVEAIGGGAARNWLLELRGPRIIARNFQAGFFVDLQHKDLVNCIQAGNDFQVPLPLTAVIQQLYTRLLVQGKGKWDNSAIVTVIEELAGTEIRPLAT